MCRTLTIMSARAMGVKGNLTVHFLPMTGWPLDHFFLWLYKAGIPFDECLPKMNDEQWGGGDENAD
ncbi:MAG: hypothetical protein ACU84H_15805 [Gammaproteobacteria bacterium]